MGRVYIDRGRLTCPGSDLSVEPDIMVVLVASLKAGRARLVPGATGASGRYIEVEGAADLVVECVSDGSARKDTMRLRELYHRAGVREYWLVDARNDPLHFHVLLREPHGFVESPAGADLFRPSRVLGAAVRLVRESEEAGLVFFRLDVR